MFCKIADPVKSWDAHWVHLIGDLLHVMRYQVENLDMQLLFIELQNLRLFENEHMLNRNGRSL